MKCGGKFNDKFEKIQESIKLEKYGKKFKIPN